MSPAQDKALTALKTFTEPATAAEVATVAGMTTMGAGQTLSKMARAGLVRKIWGNRGAGIADTYEVIL